MAKTYKVTTPAEGFSGDVVGVTFKDGEGTVTSDDQAALRYFRSHGYGVDEVKRAPAKKAADDPGKGGDQTSSPPAPGGKGSDQK